MSGVTRRTLLRSTALGSVSLFGQRAPGSPNIVFIMADDLGYADVSCYGRPDISTPNIDGLAAKGVRFLQAYANSAVCSATRTALITGRYQYRLPIGLEEPLAGRDVGLPPEHPTLPSLLKKAGLRHHADREVASGRAAEIRSSEERLRSLLRLPRRRCRLLSRMRPRKTICGTTTFRCTKWDT